MPAPIEKLTTRQVAEILGGDEPLSLSAVYQMDCALRPERSGTGRKARRAYDPAIVELVRAERARKASR